MSDASQKISETKIPVAEEKDISLSEIYKILLEIQAQLLEDEDHEEETPYNAPSNFKPSNRASLSLRKTPFFRRNITNRREGWNQ